MSSQTYQLRLIGVGVGIGIGVEKLAFQCPLPTPTATPTPREMVVVTSYDAIKDDEFVFFRTTWRRDERR